MLKILTRRTNTERLLEEYPWLWAVGPSWSPQHQIQVTTLDGFYHLEPRCSPDTSWWVYITKSGGWNAVYPVKLDPRFNVATAVCSAINWGDHITHLVSHRGDLGSIEPFVLYRAPRDTEMHVMCCNRYRMPEPEKPAEQVIPVVEVSRKQHLFWISHLWPDKARVIDSMTSAADNIARGWPPYAATVGRGLWIDFGRKVELALKPEDCVEALFTVLKYLANPEPGWDGVHLEIVD